MEPHTSGRRAGERRRRHPAVGRPRPEPWRRSCIRHGANLVLRFLLELCALAALCYWGFKTGTGPISKVVLGIGAPLAAAVLWGTFVAPAAPVSVPGALRLLLELAVFGGAAAALYSAGRPGLAWALGLAYVINRVLMFVWDQ